MTFAMPSLPGGRRRARAFERALQADVMAPYLLQILASTQHLVIDPQWDVEVRAVRAGLGWHLRDCEAVPERRRTRAVLVPARQLLIRIARRPCSRCTEPLVEQLGPNVSGSMWRLEGVVNAHRDLLRAPDGDDPVSSLGRLRAAEQAGSRLRDVRIGETIPAVALHIGELTARAQLTQERCRHYLRSAEARETAYRLAGHTGGSSSDTAMVLWPLAGHSRRVEDRQVTLLDWFIDFGSDQISERVRRVVAPEPVAVWLSAALRAAGVRMATEPIRGEVDAAALETAVELWEPGSSDSMGSFTAALDAARRLNDE